jgi:hypothetical protein
MAIDKDFVVKNGLEVNEDLLYADDSTGKVGIGTTQAHKKLVVIGDAEISENLCVGTTITAQRAVFSGVVTVTDGLDIGVGGTFVSFDKHDKKIGVNTVSPQYNLDVIGPVSIGYTAQYIYGDLTVTGNIKGTNLEGQISAGGTVTYQDVNVTETLNANGAEIFTKFRVEEVNSDTFRYLVAGDPDPTGIGFTQNTDNPTIYLNRAQKYEFHVSSAGFPFYIKSTPNADLNNIYNDGVEQNGSEVGIVTFKVPMNAPNILYYQASNTAGMGGTIYIDNDYQTYQVGVLTVTELLDSNNQADFENIYVSGIGTINNLKGPQNFSVSAGILTVRQDQTALIGVSTGADAVSIQERSNSANYQLTFTEPLGIGSNYQSLYVDSENGQLQYNPSSNTLSLDTVVASLTGIATGAQRVNIDRKSDGVHYQVAFTEPGTDEYQALYLDTQSAQFTYNPSSNTLTVANIVGDLTGDVTGTATNANFINVDETNDDTTFQVLFSPAGDTGYERPLIDTNNAQFTYNPSTQDLTVGNLNGDGSNVTSIHGPNITTGVINEARLPNASTSAQGVVQLNNTFPPTSTSTTTTITTNVARQLYNASVGVIPSGTTMLFYQSNAPSGWTQITSSVNNRALRVVNSEGANSGGNMNFTGAFASRSVPLLQHNHNANAGNQSANHSHNVSVGNAGDHKHEISDPEHSHNYEDSQAQLSGSKFGAEGEKLMSSNEDEGRTTESSNTGINETEEAGVHKHNANAGSNSANHNHTITVANAGTSGASMDFRVRYLDVIICSKNSY